jgi:glycosyltransferase involved in cell wall biosynthesis
MKILFLSPNQIHRYNWGHQLFRNEIGRQHDVIYYGEGFANFNKKLSVKEIIKQMKIIPDVIMTYGWRYSKDFKGLGEIKIPKVHFTVDYGRKEGIKRQDDFFKQNKYDLNFAITQNALRLLRKNNPNLGSHILPFSVDINKYKKNNRKKEDIVLASFTDRADIYPNRKKIKRVIRQSKMRMIQKRIIHQALINTINRCKITVTSNNIFKSLSMRYTETLACGGFLLADEPEDLQLLGLENNKHLVIYNDLKDFEDKLKYYMKKDTARNKIEKAGMEFVRNNHSCEVRVKQMTKIINNELNIK